MKSNVNSVFTSAAFAVRGKKGFINSEHCKWLHQIIIIVNDKTFAPCFHFFFLCVCNFYSTTLSHLSRRSATSSPINRPIQLRLERQSPSDPFQVNMNTVHSVRVTATSPFNTGTRLSQFPAQPITAAPESSGTIATARGRGCYWQGQSSAAGTRRKSS